MYIHNVCLLKKLTGMQSQIFMSKQYIKHSGTPSVVSNIDEAGVMGSGVPWPDCPPSML